MDATTLTQLEVQVAIPLLVGMVPIGLELLRRKLNLQADSTAAQLDAVANTAIQGAVANFAGKVSGALSAGTLSRTTAVAQLRGYLAETVADSIARIPMSDTALDTMLQGKRAALPKAAVLTPAGFDPAASLGTK